uniref:Semaphorin-1A n=1 Tax=Plectus sambesii TaxID=2011161 RepID=A0A914VET5_9BILA
MRTGTRTAGPSRSRRGQQGLSVVPADLSAPTLPATITGLVADKGAGSGPFSSDATPQIAEMAAVCQCDNAPNGNRSLIGVTSEGSLQFVGNRSAVDYFKLLELDGSHLLIGARDVVYNISMRDFSVLRSIEWRASESEVDECLMKGKPKEACHNYVRILAKDNQGGVLVCGTNAYRPKCRQYTGDKFGEYVQGIEFPGLGLCPYDPTHNSTYVRDGHMIYTGTVSDFTGADPLIHRRNVSKENDLGIRTERNDVKFLNDPQFAGSFQDDEHVFLWFREQAVEYENCGKAVYSRVARLCKKDRGGPKPTSNEWTSFVKARLNCSLPGDYPFYFDQIEAISELVSGQYMHSKTPADLVYAVFNTPLAGVRASAICAFDLRAVNKVFAESAFKSQASPRASWQPVRDFPKLRPGSCVADSSAMPEDAAAFARANPLMADVVPNFFGSPLVVHAGVDNDRFTQIAIDPQVHALDGRRYDVLFVGTDRGHVLKLINLAGAGAKTDDATVHVETLRVLEHPMSVRNLMIYREPAGNGIDDSGSESAHLLVVSDQEVRRVPLHYCSRVKSCTACVGLRDPYCAWDTAQEACVSSRSRQSGLIQDIPTGQSTLCPATDPPTIDDNSVKEPKPDIVVAGMPRISAHNIDSNFPSGTADAQTVLVAVLIATVVSLVIGFAWGYVCAVQKWCRPQPKKLSHQSFRQKQKPQTMMNPQLNSSLNGGTLQRSVSKASNVINAYEHTPKYNGRPAPIPESYPVTMSMDSGDEPLRSAPPTGEFVHNAFATSTLPKDYRVKKMYL